MRSGAGIYCLVVGVLMLAWWAVDIRRGALARPDRARPEIILHLVAEMVTAALLAAGGAILIAGGITGLALAGLGMLLYTVIASLDISSPATNGPRLLYSPSWPS